MHASHDYHHDEALQLGAPPAAPRSDVAIFISQLTRSTRLFVQPSVALVAWGTDAAHAEFAARRGEVYARMFNYRLRETFTSHCRRMRDAPLFEIAVRRFVRREIDYSRGWWLVPYSVVSLRSGNPAQNTGFSGLNEAQHSQERSLPEGELRRAVPASELPEPLWNPRVFLPDGTFLCSPDGLWEEEGVAVEVDSVAHHAFGLDRMRTVERAQRMQAAGLTVVSVLPRQLRTDPAAVIGTLRAILDGPRRAPGDLPALVVRRAAGGARTTTSASPGKRGRARDGVR